MEHMNIDDEVMEYLEHDWGKGDPKSQAFSDHWTDQNVKRVLADARQMELQKKQEKVTKY